MAGRPVSPHLQIWKWGPHMLVSILHRISGQGMAFVGLPLLVWWLGALASGPEAYLNLQEWLWFGSEGGIQAVTAVLGKIALVGLSWAFFNHVASGLRHLVLDIGAGYEIETNRRWSVGTIVAGIVMTAAFWAAIILL